MKNYNLSKNEILSEGANVSYSQDAIQLSNDLLFKDIGYLNSIDDSNCKGSNLIPKIVNKLCVVGEGSNPPTLHADFMIERKNLKRTGSTSILPDELNNKDCHLKPHKSQVFLKTPSDMHDKEKKTLKELLDAKSLFKRNKSFTVYDRIRQELTKYNAQQHFMIFDRENHFVDKLKKNLRIKYLNNSKEQIQSIIPTENYIRIYELYYPLSSSFLLSDKNNQTGYMIMGD